MVEINTQLLGRIESISVQPNSKSLAPRVKNNYITVHYSGVDYNQNISKTKEYDRIIDETWFHVRKNWGSKEKPFYGDGLMYDYVVLNDGEIVQTRRNRQQLWHCGNVIGNKESWSLHVMTGPSQKLTAAQKSSLYRLIDKLRAECDIPVNNVVGHCEWPRGNGVPVVNSTYSPLPKQSVCPGKNVMETVIEYRSLSSLIEDISAKEMFVVDNAEFAPVYTDRSFASPVAVIEDNVVRLFPGTSVPTGDYTNGWYHITTGIGFVHESFLKAHPSDPNPEVPPSVPVIKEHRVFDASIKLVPYVQADVDEQLIVDYLSTLPKATYTKEAIAEIVGYYRHYGELTGVDWVYALAQNLHETDHLRSWWSQRPRRNPAGLRVTGEKRKVAPDGDPHWAHNPNTNLWHKGMSFPSWEESVRCHIAYLLSYAYTNNQLNPIQREFIRNTSVSFILDRSVNRGIAYQAIGLNGKWAVPGTTYAQSIAKVANKLATLQKER